VKLQKDLNLDREKFEEEKNEIGNRDVIRLNVGGEIIMTTRETLTRIPKSTLAIMFNGRWEHKLPIDKNGNIIFDFNAALFRHLLDQLQILDTNHPIHFYPPVKPSLVEPFTKMLQKLGLHQLLSIEKNIVSFNVGGHIIKHRSTTFTEVFNSSFNTIVSSSKTSNFDRKSDIFLDNDPKLFHYLINQLREVPSKNISYLKAPSSKTTNSFKRMLNDLSINRKYNIYLLSLKQVLIIMSFIVGLRHSILHIDKNTKWIQNGITIAGGHGKGNGLIQLDWPESIYIDDDDRKIYIADSDNHRIVEWKFDSNISHIVAGGNGQGNRIDQLDYPADVIVDKTNDSLIICDCRNRRVVRWSRRNTTHGQTIIFDIDCYGLAMDNNGDLYVSDLVKNEVRRWKIGQTNGVIVAGGNGEGNHLNQLYLPTSIFVDQDHTVYVSDEKNHRVMKWMQDAQEGIIVAGGQGQGDNLTQLSYPRGVIVDRFGNVYVADSNNHRVMRWPKESQIGSIVVGGNGEGKQSNQFHYCKGLSFDRQGNLYVVDWDNNRVQKFDVDLH
jgi:sugar lactone lactonase YvrE